MTSIAKTTVISTFCILHAADRALQETQAERLKSTKKLCGRRKCCHCCARVYAGIITSAYACARSFWLRLHVTIMIKDMQLTRR